MAHIGPIDPQTFYDLLNAPLASDSRSGLKKSPFINSVLPAVERGCAPSEMEQKNLTDVTDEYNQEVRRLRRQYEDPYTRDTLGPRLFKNLSDYVSAYYSFDEKQNVFLEDIIFFGLSHGLTENDIFTISMELDWHIDDGDYLLGMMTVVSLRVAKILYENRYLYGSYRNISPLYDFSSFVDRMEYLIAKGDIGVRPMTIGDPIDMSVAGAFYNPGLNEIALSPYAQDSSLDIALGFIIHECRHALQDYEKASGTNYTFEFDSDLNAEIATQLLGLTDRVGDRIGTERIDELNKEIAGLTEEMQRDNLRCLAYDDEMMGFYEALNREIDDRYALWQDVVFDEIEGRVSQSAAAYYNYYELQSLKNTLALEESWWARDLVGLSEEELRDEYDGAREELIRLYERMETISSSSPHTPEHGQTTYDYLTRFEELRAITYLLDRDLWKDLTYMLFSQANEIAEGLMYIHRNGDGV